MSTETKCLGCGSILQNSDKTMPGYVENLEATYCKSCYQLKNYGIATDHFHPESLPELKSKSLIVMVSSVMHLDMLFSYRVDRYYPNEKYLYIINQMDLLPESTNLDYLMDQIVRKARKNKIPYEDIVFMSALKKEDISSLEDYLLSYKEKIFIY
ncbi:GTP-binding protein, putative fragment [Alteracholeplasma palmae J233]|uniref:GTP-binding protein, putative n=1 Tax=Alteracholeplasma palmae (strain ATCC 49389 / J233) TaxID=1318466 RepID=U4KKS2_ALTPJ|nr:GTP-binding protein [Alteracholeplasma palmae]CCV64277.1 GTP-binding protein, putative fragment [Alteracholeplasma palmae J233]